MDLVESQMLSTANDGGRDGSWLLLMAMKVPSVSLWARSVTMSAWRNSKACSGSRHA